MNLPLITDDLILDPLALTLALLAVESTLPVEDFECTENISSTFGDAKELSPLLSVVDIG